MERVVVGMSGGIDSFVTALLLQQQGYEVVGVTLVLWEENESATVAAICRTLGIPLLRRDGRTLFRQTIVAAFVGNYCAGMTPNPCCRCNSFVKWTLLEQVAEEVGAKYLATGHYVRKIQRDGYFYFQKGIDPQKDQSYFLWGVPQRILARALTPLGVYTKKEVKEWAGAHGYEALVRKKENMGVCFLQGKDYRDFIREYGGREVEKPGKILNRQGDIIGEHPGLLNYTVGQKRGLPRVQGEALYVAEIDVVHNRIIADVKTGLWTNTLDVEQVRAVNLLDLSASDIVVKVRGIGLNPEGFARIEKWHGNSYRIHLSAPAWAVAPGQPVAFYQEDVLIGGGIAVSRRT